MIPKNYWIHSSYPGMTKSSNLGLIGLNRSDFTIALGVEFNGSGQSLIY